MEPKELGRDMTVVARALGYFLYVVVIVAEVILALGFVLLLLGADPSAGFTQWAYRSLDRVMAPFRGIFTPVEVGTSASGVEAVLDTSVLFAMVVYGIVLLALRALIDWLSGRVARTRWDDQQRLAHEQQLERDRLYTSTGGSDPVPPRR